MSDTFEPAIEALKQQLAKEEMRLDETRSLLNRLCEMAGRPKMFPDISPPVASQAAPSRQTGMSRTRLSMAVQDYLDTPRATSLGALSRFEISV
jgi:DNA-binding transcriptional regulator GbsR (MarR family)